MTTINDYRAWLEKALNDAAYECASYVRANGEAPPETMEARYGIYRMAWDGYCFLVENNEAYLTHSLLQYLQYIGMQYEAYLHDIKDKYPLDFDRFLSERLPDEWKL